MYAVATYRLSLAADFPPMRDLSRGIVWIAFAAWAIAMVGLVRSGRDRPRASAA